tara:strand:+ start:5759 stop:6718 length:960 start_codon:yes stop_codon:yes gene_type:complete
MRKLKIGLIGCGKIAGFHVDSLRAAGFIVLAVAGRKNSKNVNFFAKKYKIKDIWKDPLKLAKQNTNYVDAFLVAVSIDESLKYLKILSETRMPALFEKPITYNYLNLEKYRFNRNILVAFNRRFYSSVYEAKKFVNQNNPCIVRAEVPENMIIRNNKIIFNKLFSNSIHVFDLLIFLFGDLKFKSKLIRGTAKKADGVVALFYSNKKDVINYIGNWNASSNFSITIDYKNKRYQLLPIEKAKIFFGKKVVQPTKKIPIRTTIPKIYKDIKITKYEKLYKPGFYLQSKEFYRFVKTGKFKTLANINDTIKALKIAQILKF